jgi:hypothetical protein
MRKLPSILLILCATAVLGQPSADDIARRTINNLAGPQWDAARYIAFTFDVEAGGKQVASWAQRWDRYTGDYRVSGKDREGNDVVVVINTNTKAGHAWKNGTEVADPKDLLTLGYRRFINDTYWLLMPIKSMDPGVHREIAPERTDSCGRVEDVVHLYFDPGVGLTPADHYWMVVNRDTGLVDEWDMKLTGSKPEDEPSAVVFRDYRRIGGLLLSTRREIKGKNPTIIKLDDITVSHDVPAGAFGK